MWKCDICNKNAGDVEDLNPLLNRILVFYDFDSLFEMQMAILEEEEKKRKEANCDCHPCSHTYCSTKIRSYQSYCAKHTVSDSNSKCRGDEFSHFKSAYERALFGECNRKVVTSDGYCSKHENQCAECDNRIWGDEKYCYQHSNGYCQVIDCHQQTPNSRYSNYYIYCKEHAKLYGNSPSNYQQAQAQQRIQQQQRKEAERLERTEQDKLKSLVKANTSITGKIEEVTRVSPLLILTVLK